jgi:NAD(P)-dependent dehydrogenase (short-subunit alcohol dehydrogenase family)
MSQDRIFLTDQVSIVTGAASGIGRATAVLLASRGAHVVALDVNEAGLKSVVEEIKNNGGSASSQILDLGSEENVRTTVKSIETEYGKIDSVVNAGGITGPTGTLTESISWDQFLKPLTVNLFGAIWITQAVMPLMKERKYGRIVQVVSIAGKEGNPGMSPYNTAKAGLIGYVKGVAKEAAASGVVINSIAPAVIRTAINENTTEETMKYMLSRIPMGRIGESEEVAEMIAFMASPACSFTTGFTFDISGGRATY